MKKLFFLFGFSLCFNFMMAQDLVYLTQDDAVDALKTYLVENPADLSQNAAIAGISDDRLEASLIKGLLNAIDDNGNTASTVNAYFDNVNFRSAEMAKIPAIKELAIGLITKSE